MLLLGGNSIRGVWENTTNEFAFEGKGGNWELELGARGTTSPLESWGNLCTILAIE